MFVLHVIRIKERLISLNDYWSIVEIIKNHRMFDKYF
jgi:hypothetical protein